MKEDWLEKGRKLAGKKTEENWVIYCFQYPEKFVFGYHTLRSIALHCSLTWGEGTIRYNGKQADRLTERQTDRQHKAQCNTTFLSGSPYAVEVKMDEWKARNLMTLKERDRESYLVRIGIVEWMSLTLFLVVMSGYLCLWHRNGAKYLVSMNYVIFG